MVTQRVNGGGAKELTAGSRHRTCQSTFPRPHLCESLKPNNSKTVALKKKIHPPQCVRGRNYRLRPKNVLTPGFDHVYLGCKVGDFNMGVYGDKFLSDTSPHRNPGILQFFEPGSGFTRQTRDTEC